MRAVTAQAMALQKLRWTRKSWEGRNAWRGKPWGDLGKQT